MNTRGDNAWLNQDPIAEINELKRKLIFGGKEIIDLSMINPDILPSTYIIDKLHEFTIKPFNHRYAVSRGVRKLREAFCEKYRLRFGIKVDPETEVCVSSGTKDAIIHALLATTHPGDSVLVGAPTYPVYLSAAHLARVNVGFFEMDPDEAVMLNRIEAAIAKTGSRVLLLNFPNNPTGQTVSEDFYVKLGKITAATGVTVINDFVYGEMGYDAQPTSLLTMREQNPYVLETYSLSKAYSVPGWRVGAAIGNRSIIQDIARLKSHSDYGLFLPLQLAAAAVLTAKQDLVSPILNQYSKRRNFLVSGLQEAGWNAEAPKAGASLWVKLPDTLREKGATHFCRSLLESQEVLLTPGSLFGRGCDTSVRFALVCSEERLAEVLKRMAHYSHS